MRRRRRYEKDSNPEGIVKLSTDLNTAGLELLTLHWDQHTQDDHSGASD